LEENLGTVGTERCSGGDSALGTEQDRSHEEERILIMGISVLEY